jgi:hypothetical protein
MPDVHYGAVVKAIVVPSPGKRSAKAISSLFAPANCQIQNAEKKRFSTGAAQDDPRQGSQISINRRSEFGMLNDLVRITFDRPDSVDGAAGFGARYLSDPGRARGLR